RSGSCLTTRYAPQAAPSTNKRMMTRKRNFFMGTSSAGKAGYRKPASHFFPGPFGRFLRFFECHQFAFLQPAEHHQILVITFAHLDSALQELLPFLDVHRGFAVVEKTGSRRNQ